MDESKAIFRVFSFRRWSKASQTDGDSDRRQLKAALEYCQKMDWPEPESLVDPGKSAFRGSHLREGGSLARFFRMVETGIVKPDDKLIFEGFDRFSRQPPDIALPLFLDLIRAGVEIHTTFDGSVYNRQSVRTNQGQLYSTLSYMWAAHLESKNKSGRIRDAWKGRRDRPTLVCPAWVKPNADTTGYDLIPPHATVIERIYQLALQGHGVEWIAKSLNREGVEAFGRHVLDGTQPKRKPSFGWHHSYIRTLLTDRRVIGEAEFFEWHPDDHGEVERKATGIRRKLYPAAVSEELYTQVQATRRTTNQGRNGATMANLFSGGIARCACGSNMTLIRKGARSNYPYLQCNDARRHQMSCVNRKLHRYDVVEAFVLTLFGALAYGDLTPDAGSVALKTELASAQRAAEDIEKDYARFATTVRKGTAGPLAAKQLAAIEAEHVAALEQVSAIQRQLSELGAKPLTADLEEVQGMINKMDSLDGDERLALRSRINRGLRRFIKEIRFNDPQPPRGATRPADFIKANEWYVRFTPTFHASLPRDGVQAKLLMLMMALENKSVTYKRNPDGTTRVEGRVKLGQTI